MQTNPKPPLAAHAPPRSAVPWPWVVASCCLTTCLVGPCGVGIGWWAGSGKAPSGAVVAGKVAKADDPVGNANKDVQADPTAKAGAFDGKDLKKTGLWSQALWLPVTNAFLERNEIAEKSATLMAEKEFTKAKGQSVDWLVELTGITNDGLSVKAADGTSIGLRAPGEVRIFPIPKGKWVLAAKAGDMLRVKGTIVGHEHDDSRADLFLIFLVSNATFEPVKK